MNILLLTQFFSETRGGGEYVFKLLASSLVKNNHKVWIITNKITGETYDSQENLNIIFVKPTLFHNAGKPPSFIENVRYCVNAIKEGRKIIKKDNIDVIHSNNFAPSFVGSILSSLTSKPHVLTIHDVFSLCTKNYQKMWSDQRDVSKINSVLTPIFEKLIIKLRHDCIHTVSDATKDDLIKLGEKKPIHVIYNTVNRNPYDQKPAKTFEFVYIGRLLFYKNLEVAVKAIDIARKSEPQIRLVIAGQGPHRQALEELTKVLGLEKNIEFKGYVTTDKKIELLATSCALVFPSLCEGFGIVILEAFDQSKPVLVSNVRPMSDIVSNGNNGFVLDPHDENEWANCFLRIIKNSSEAIEMGRNGNRLLTTWFTQEAAYQKILELYSKITKK
jgi:glycosyltransferase involved in cell wall biosynthesis